MRRARRAAALVLLVLIAAGCADRADRAADPAVSVVATFSTLAEFAGRIGGGRVAVRTLVPPGTPPHDYEPAPRDRVVLEQARVFVFNGVGLEPWLDRVLADLPAAIVRVDASARITPREGDPHVWLDPALAAAQVEAIREGLIEADPGGRAQYEAGAAALRADLEALDRRYAQVLGTCRRKEFVTSHAAFGYLAARFGLREEAIAGVDPEGEPSPARIRDVVAFVRASGTTVVFAEPGGPDRVAETVAREAGARVAVLDPMEGGTSESYLAVMDDNLSALADALDCRR